MGKARLGLFGQIKALNEKASSVLIKFFRRIPSRKIIFMCHILSNCKQDKLCKIMVGYTNITKKYFQFNSKMVQSQIEIDGVMVTI